jgi:hypothetical protein
MELDKTPVMQLRLGLWVRFGSIKNPAEEREIYVSILNQAPVVAQREARSRPMLARGLTHFAIRDHYFAGHAICAANADQDRAGHPQHSLVYRQNPGVSTPANARDVLGKTELVRIHATLGITIELIIRFEFKQRAARALLDPSVNKLVFICLGELDLVLSIWRNAEKRTEQIRCFRLDRAGPQTQQQIRKKDCSGRAAFKHLLHYDSLTTYADGKSGGLAGPPKPA